MNANGAQRFGVVVQVPDLQREVVARNDVATVAAEFNVGNGRNDFREERLLRWIFRLHVEKKKIVNWIVVEWQCDTLLQMCSLLYHTMLLHACHTTNNNARTKVSDKHSQSKHRYYFDGAFRTAIHEQIGRCWMKFSARNHFSQFLKKQMLFKFIEVFFWKNK